MPPSAPGEDYGYEARSSPTSTHWRWAAAPTTSSSTSIRCPSASASCSSFTHRPIERTDFTPISLTPQQALAEWQAQGLRHVYVDGGVVISAFLEAGLIDDLTLTIVPLLLGDGLPLFHPGRPETRLTLEESKTFPSGVVWLRYRRASDRPEPAPPPAGERAVLAQQLERLEQRRRDPAAGDRDPYRPERVLGLEPQALDQGGTQGSLDGRRRPVLQRVQGSDGGVEGRQLVRPELRRRPASS